ncbi:hypothetical protein K502DRAFT_363526 [Neoconidiobolus thromboides FSU 785]|nr:hypothetical protein K502DRAFT_363526 [Neoconidiobolus thromboides FSU 785]
MNYLNDTNSKASREITPRDSNTPSNNYDHNNRIPSYLYNKPSSPMATSDNLRSPNRVSVSSSGLNMYSPTQNRFQSNYQEESIKSFSATEEIAYNSTSHRHSHRDSHHKRPKKKKNCCIRCCCCCCRSRTGALICGIFTILLLIGIGVGAFFLWPRIPTVELISVTQTNTNAPIDQTSFNNLFQSNNNNLQAQVNINLRVQNLNYIDIVINQITLTGDLQNNIVTIPNSLTGKLPKPVALKAQNISPLILPVTIILPGTSSASNDQLMGLREVCESKQNLMFNYHISLELPLVSWTGYKPKLNNSYSFKCPWNIN